MSKTQTSPCCGEKEPASFLLGFSRPFIAFLGGSLVSRMGDALFTFALPWIAYELTHSSAVLATLYATEIVPVVLFGAFAGVYVDRLNRRFILLGTDLLRALLVAVVPFLSLLGLLQIWELYTLAFSLALLSLANDVATTAVLPEMAQSETTRANAAYQFIMQAAEFAGPALAGLAIAVLGGFHTLWLDALSFGGTFLVIWRLSNFSGGSRGPRDRRVFSEMREGFLWLWREPVIKMLSLQAMLGNLGLGMVSAVLLYYLRAQLQLPAQLAGLDYAMVGVGGLLGSLLIVPFTHLFRQGTLYPVLLFCGLLGRVSIIFLPWWWIPGLSLGIVAACDTAWVIMSTSVRQERIPGSLMGRVLSFSRLLSTAAMPLGAVIGGFLAQNYSLLLVFGLAALTKGGEVFIARFSEIHRL
jgi:predicted MFS family arabinose efflux permease